MDNIYRTTQVIINGCDYRPGCCIILGYDDESHPECAVVESISAHDHVKYFMVQLLEILQLDQNTNALKFCLSNDTRLLETDDMLVAMPDGNRTTYWTLDG